MEIEVFTFESEGENFRVELSKHATQRRVEREVSLNEIEESLILAGDELLSLKLGEKLAVRKLGEHIVIVQVYTIKDSFDIQVEVVTVMGQFETKLYKPINSVNV